VDIAGRVVVIEPPEGIEGTEERGVIIDVVTIFLGSSRRR
jgi:hypothetical protein